jgi:hypothetical protein
MLSGWQVLLCSFPSLLLLVSFFQIFASRRLQESTVVNTPRLVLRRQAYGLGIVTRTVASPDGLPPAVLSGLSCWLESVVLA